MIYKFHAFNESIKTVIPVYYHGCDNAKQGEVLMSTGILQPQVTVKTMSHIVGLMGKVYVTPEIEYAMNFAKHNERQGGAFGYLAMVKGESIVNPTPDEDYVSYTLTRLLKKRTDYIVSYEENFYRNVDAWSDEQKKQVMDLRYKLTSAQQSALMSDMQTISSASNIGKKLIGYMPPILMDLFVNSGSSISCDPVPYSELYQFNKKELMDNAYIPFKGIDYGSIFDHMERIK